MGEWIYYFFAENPWLVAPILFVIGGFLLYGGIGGILGKPNFVINICLLGYDDSGCFPEFYRRLGIYICLIGLSFNSGGILYILFGPHLFLVIPVIIGIIGFILYVGHVTKYANP